VSSDDLVIDETRYEIRRNGTVIRVEPKIFDLIRLLSKSAGRVVPRDELLAALWPNQRVTDASLRRAVGEARRALGPENRIKTVPRRGLTWVESASRDASPQRGWVGREREMGELRESWAGVQAGASACHFVCGEAGIGKTTLLDAFVGDLVGAAGRVVIARAACDPSEGLAEPHQVWLRLLEQLVGGSGGRRALAALRRLAPSWSAQLAGGAAPAPPPANPRARLLRELAAFLGALGERRSLVLALDDLHAADASSLDLLFGLVRLRGSARVLLLGAYRPHEEQTATRPLDSEVHALRVRGLARETRLGALGVADVARYAAARLGAGEPQVAALAEQLHRRSEGNPLFFSALLDAWIERGALDRGSLARAAEGLAADLPASLAAVIGLELAKLAPQAQRLLAAGSVCGLEFSAASAAEVAAIPVAQAASALEGLAQRGRFVRQLPAADARFAFVHELTRDALYAGLAEAGRRALHLNAAAHVGALASSTPAEQARHFELGGAPERALPLRVAAAVSAGARFGYPEAALHLRAALAALQAARPASRERDAQELPLQLGLTMAELGASGSASDAALATLKRAEALCVALGDARRPLILAGLWNSRVTRAELAAAVSIAQEIRALAENGAPGLGNLAQLQIGVTLFYQGDFARAAKHLERVLADEPAARTAAASLFDDVDPAVVARAYLAWLHALAGRTRRSNAARRAAVTLALRHASPQGQALALSYSAALLAERGKAAPARREAERALRVAEECGLAQWGGVARAVAGYARVLGREGEAGLRELESGIAAYHATGARVSTSFLLSLRARALGRLGRPADAKAALGEASEHAARTGEHYYAATLRRLARELRAATAPKRTTV